MKKSKKAKFQLGKQWKTTLYEKWRAEDGHFFKEPYWQFRKLPAEAVTFDTRMEMAIKLVRAMPFEPEEIEAILSGWTGPLDVTAKRDKYTEMDPT